ncbi:TIGR02677 family protein [Bacillus thuringiensis]|uniref:TIGR02677 family protein n=1 Tax=Bacillus thuringiensis TaxID=1428 RepID=UPI0037FFAC1C
MSKIHHRMLQPSTSMKYLGEINYRHYVSIIHYLYEQHALYYAPPSLTNDIYQALRESDTYGLFTEYTLRDLELDLVQLETWGNVVSHADNSNVSSIEDFKKRRLRYQCTQETVEIERLMETLHQKTSKLKGSLDSNLMNSLASTLLDLEVAHDKELSEVFVIWSDVFVKFDTFRKEAADYLAIIHGKGMEEAMRNREITPFRQPFTRYLSDFIVALQRNTSVIEDIIRNMRERGYTWVIFHKLAEHQFAKPVIDREWREEDFVEIYREQWRSLESVFHDKNGQERYVNYLLRQTSVTISKFTKALQIMTERENGTRSRKHEYLHLAQLFHMSDVEHLAGYLSLLTNIEYPPHFVASEARNSTHHDTMYTNKSYTPQLLTLRDAKRGGGAKRRKIPAITRSEDEIRMQRELEEEVRMREDEIRTFARGTIVLADLPPVPPYIRSCILDWIGKSMGKEGKGKTEYGLRYTVWKQSEATVRLRSPDGVLTLPDYVLQFEVKT